MAIVGKLLLFPFKILGWLFRHPRILILLVVIAFIFFGVRACTSTFNKSTGTATAVELPKVAEYQTIAPSTKQAPYVVSTGTRIYYVAKYTDNKQLITLQQYFTFDKNTWQVHKTPLLLDRKYYGEITIIKR
jgi:hypothetical protein